MVEPAPPVEWNEPVVSPPVVVVEPEPFFYCLANPTVPECAPAPVTSGLGRG